MKANVIYQSRFSGRQWKKQECGLMITRGDNPGEIWKESGSHGVPDMRECDVDFYINRGDFFEVHLN